MAKALLVAVLLGAVAFAGAREMSNAGTKRVWMRFHRGNHLGRVAAGSAWGAAWGAARRAVQRRHVHLCCHAWLDPPLPPPPRTLISGALAQEDDSNQVEGYT
jgi:hypothetical protein